MSIPVTPNDPRVRIFVNDTWEDIYRRVRQSDGNMINIQTGNEDEALGDEINPGVCEFVLYNNDGAFTPDNPVSPYYPDLEVNTPICILTDEVIDLFSRTVPEGWNNSTTGETYSTKSVNGTISASDYSVDGSMGVHSVPATNAYRMTYFGSSSRAPTAYNLVQKIRYTPQLSDVTGANIEVANLQCRLQSDTQYYMLRAEVTTTESITLKIYRNDSTLLAGPITVPGVTHTVGQPIWFAFGAFDDDLFVTAWQGDDIEDEPTGWLLKATDTTYGFGRYGVRTGVATGNTNAQPIIAKYDHYRVYISEFNGEIAEWPQEHSDDGKDRIVPITAGGILRRYTENRPLLGTALRRYYEQFTFAKPNKYWALEDGELTIEARASVGNASDIAFFQFDTFNGVDTASEKHFAQGKLGARFINGVQALNTDQLRVQSPGAAVTTDRIAVEWVRSGGSQTRDVMTIVGYFAPGVTIGGIDGDIYSIECNAFTSQITVSPGLFATPIVANLSVSQSRTIFDGAAHHFFFRFNSTGGAPTDIAWRLEVDQGVFLLGGTVADHPMIQNLVITYMNVIASADATPIPSKPVSYGHVAWFTEAGDPDAELHNVYVAFTGHTGETVEERLVRLCQQQGIKCFNNTTIGAIMGPQYADSFIDQLEEMVRTDGGVVNELMGGRALHFYTLENIRSRAVQLTLDVNSEHVMPGWKPVRDNQRLKNKITAVRRDGGDYTYSRTTGRLSVLDPKLGGAGEYKDDVKTNAFNDEQLIGVAQREVSEGTVDKPRYPLIGVNLMSPSISGNLTLRRQVLDMFITGRLNLTGMENWHIYEDADLLVIGHKRTLGPYTHFVEFNTIPFQSLNIFHVETEDSILGTDSSFLAAAIDNDDTALDVYTTGRQTLWTTEAGSFPIIARSEGEDIQVTDIDTLAPSFRSVGTVSHGDNATLNPALPAGQLVGDQLICVQVIRNEGAVANVPAGYSPRVATSHFMISTKISVGAGESAPSCTFSGGAAGDTTSAFVIASQNSPLIHSDGGTPLLNGSFQNIAIPSTLPTKSNGILWVFAWKKDDWTSVAPPTWLTEVVDASTATGNDQGVWAGYLLIPYNRDASPSDTLVVTGGASAISDAIVLYFANPQRFTVVRNLNNLPGGKSHPISAAITIAYPKVLG